MAKPRVFTIEMGFDLYGKIPPHKEYHFLPNGIAQNKRLSSYCRLKHGDKIHWRIFDITNTSDGPENVIPYSLENDFSNARRDQRATSPFNTTVSFDRHQLHGPYRRHSAVFDKKFYAWDAVTPFIIHNTGFFFVTFKLTVQVAGDLIPPERLFRTDPEMIIHAG